MFGYLENKKKQEVLFGVLTLHTCFFPVISYCFTSTAQKKTIIRRLWAFGVLVFDTAARMQYICLFVSDSPSKKKKELCFFLFSQRQNKE